MNLTRGMGFKDVAKRMLLDGLKIFSNHFLICYNLVLRISLLLKNRIRRQKKQIRIKTSQKIQWMIIQPIPMIGLLRKMFVRRLRQRIIQVEDIANGKIKKQEKQFDVGIRKDEKTEKSDLLIGMIILKMMVQRISPPNR